MWILRLSFFCYNSYFKRNYKKATFYSQYEHNLWVWHKPRTNPSNKFNTCHCLMWTTVPSLLPRLQNISNTRAADTLQNTGCQDNGANSWWREQHPALAWTLLVSMVWYGKHQLQRRRLMCGVVHESGCAGAKRLVALPPSLTHTKITFMCLTLTQAHLTLNLPSVLPMVMLKPSMLKVALRPFRNRCFLELASILLQPSKHPLN